MLGVWTHFSVLLLLYFGRVNSQFSGLQGSNQDENSALQLLQEYERDAPPICNDFMRASWQFTTNVTEYNKRVMVAIQKRWIDFHRRTWKEATQYKWKDFQPQIRRMFSFITVLDRGALSDSDFLLYTNLLQEMKSLHATAQVCTYDPNRGGQRQNNGDVELINIDYYDYDSDNENDVGCTPTLSLEPDLIEKMATSRNPSELRYYWKAWRDVVGRPLRRKFLTFVDLSNKAANKNGYEDAGQFSRREYEMVDLKDQLEDLWEQLQPLYLQLHAYVRRKLRERYGDNVVPKAGPIPAHLLGNMWAQSWTPLLDFTLPYKGISPLDVTDRMKRRNWSPITLFKSAENFFVSMGLEPMPQQFWRRSMFTKPSGRKVVCHASAWDFCDRQDYRIRQCTKVSMDDLVTAHHEMGHIQYNMLYRNQPFVFREGANPGFHEAVGDAISLSVSSPTYLEKIGLLDSTFDDSYESQINFLFSTAMDKIAFLPFGYLLDLWRWEVFDGDADESNLNSRWWEMRLRYQGVTPPLVRTEDDFDPGSKFHVAANINYIRYFVSFILQFQIHAELCKAAGHTGPLHRCDVYGSKDAGRLLKRVLGMGRSRPWTEALATLTNGHTRLDARPVLEFFAPLMTWLESENRQEFIGWPASESLLAGQQALSTGGLIGVVFGIFLLLVVLLALFLFTCWACNKNKDLPTVPS